jgi:hypothetical protein
MIIAYLMLSSPNRDYVISSFPIRWFEAMLHNEELHDFRSALVIKKVDDMTATCSTQGEDNKRIENVSRNIFRKEIT